MRFKRKRVVRNFCVPERERESQCKEVEQVFVNNLDAQINLCKECHGGVLMKCKEESELAKKL